MWQSADVVMGRYLDGKSKGGVYNSLNLGLYGYGYQNPVKYTDPDGKWVETAWDVFNIGLGVASFADNVKQGNYWSAALDAVGVAVDVAATAAPGIPGGAGAAIKAARGADRGIDALKEAKSSEKILQEAANKAEQAVGGKGSVAGTKKHTAFEKEVKASGEGRFETEVSYKGGEVVKRGTPGSVRPDVVEGSSAAPTAIYDLKTGGAKLTEKDISRIRENLPATTRVRSQFPLIWLLFPDPDRCNVKIYSSPHGGGSCTLREGRDKSSLIDSDAYLHSSACAISNSIRCGRGWWPRQRTIAGPVAATVSAGAVGIGWNLTMLPCAGKR